MRNGSGSTASARGHRLLLLIPLIVLPALATPVVGQGTNDLASKLMSQERGLWNAWRDQDWTVFRRDVADNAVTMHASGPALGRETALSGMEKNPCEVRSFSLGDEHVVEVAPGTAVVVYKAEQDATCGGQKVPGTVWATSVWVQKDGKWQNVLHQEVPAEEDSGM